MPKLRILFATLALWICGVNAALACAPGDKRLAGHYYLNGVMEVGSELLLRPDGSFEFMLAYGANDQYGRGCWVRRGSTVEVIPSGRSAASPTHTPDDRSFGGMVLTVSGAEPGLGYRRKWSQGQV